jgi:hypothetical protein
MKTDARRRSANVQSEVNEMTPSGKPRTMGERMREAMEMPEMKEGGKVRGYGKARGGKACKMM